MAKLYFRYGAMGSSKTANAVMVQYNYRERGQQVLMLKPKIENRDGATVVRSRCGLVAQCRYVEELGGIDLTGIDCIIVDECHFMNAAQVRQLRPATQIVILSAYDRFDYAQKAINYNIIRYLLKPISAAELSEALFDIRRSSCCR